MRKPRPNLQRWYSNYNHKFFNSALPKDASVGWENMDSRLLGYMQPGKIRINAKLSNWKQQWRMTLMHEMVHMYLPKRVHHGPRFDAEMRRLASEGAFNGLW